MTDLLQLILGLFASLFRSRANLEAEVLILRQQINVLRRDNPERRQAFCIRALFRQVQPHGLPKDNGEDLLAEI